MALLTGIVASSTWLLVGGPASGATAAVSRWEGVPARITVSVDGLTASVPGAGSADEVLRAIGVARGAGDRLSSPPDVVLRAGSRIALDRGLPVTLIEGGQVRALRAARGSVADLLVGAQLALGPLDRVEPGLSAPVNPGEVVRVTRISEHIETISEAVAFPVRVVLDADLERGRQIVDTAGRPGSALATYLVRVVDGQESDRVVLERTLVAAPLEELRRVGIRAPAVAGDIESIIREAAARFGADPEQLLRVAWCESRYNPNAYNTSSGASGLFQFMPATWAANSVRAGYAGASPFDPVASANVAAWMFARGAAAQWTCR